MVHVLKTHPLIAHSLIAAFLMVHVLKTAALDPVRGNCKSRKRICTSVDVSEPLPKRARRSKKSMSV